MASTPPDLKNAETQAKTFKTAQPYDATFEEPFEEKAGAEDHPSPTGPSSAHSIRTARTEQDQPDGQNERQQDVERLQTTTTNTPVWSVFSTQQKRFIVFMVALAGFFSPLSANIYFPALNTLAADFGTTESVMNLTLTTYMIFQGLAPTIFGDLADMAGRRPAYIIGFTIYLGACIGIASCNTFPALLVLRMLQSSGSSSTIALGSGVVADIATSAERGVWMGWATSGPMVAPAIAPVLGGLFTQFLGWRWIFWFLLILAGTFLVPFLLTFPETGRKVVGNGSIPPQGWNMSLINYLQVRRQRRDAPPLERTLSQQSNRTAQQALKHKRKLRIPNPLHALSLIREKDVGLLLFYNSIIYCAFYDVMASAPSLLQEVYGFDALQIGLCFLPMGTGCLIATVVSGKLMDWNFRRIAKKVGYEIVRGKANDLRNFPLETCRIQIALPTVMLAAAAILCYGWVMQVETNLAAPLILMCITGFASTSAFNVMSVMLVDLHPLAPATATAANNLVRCLLGAGATAVIIYMIDAMGRGWCFTFIALVVVALSPILWALERWGPGWREARRLRAEGTKKRKENSEEDKRNETTDDTQGHETEKT
ncbi:related to dityrosine transporter [Lecanosticta acicola]|uniref:Related to dityrosine transporter n=1 Tax=Lecanosticta acicola TaxID=111012 RepID=A0AAI8YZN2_9PEZI|nr:related to dityrosine transporter [Lecanosticta acicola]